MCVALDGLNHAPFNTEKNEPLSLKTKNLDKEMAPKRGRKSHFLRVESLIKEKRKCPAHWSVIDS